MSSDEFDEIDEKPEDWTYQTMITQLYVAPTKMWISPHTDRKYCFLYKTFPENFHTEKYEYVAYGSIIDLQLNPEVWIDCSFPLQIHLIQWDRQKNTFYRVNSGEIEYKVNEYIEVYGFLWGKGMPIVNYTKWEWDRMARNAVAVKIIHQKDLHGFIEFEVEIVRAGWDIYNEV